MSVTTPTKSLCERLAGLAMFLSAPEIYPAPEEMRERGLAVYLEQLAQELERDYVQVGNLPNERVPTAAQGIALARFLRPHFNSSRNLWGAFVSRGGAGLGDNYLYVRMNDGYEGGIDKEGHVST